MRRVTVADYLSLVRIPLGGMFLLVADRVGLALGVLAAAGLSDVLDGWVARRQRRDRAADASAPPHRGDWLDPLCDKLFVLAVVLGLYLARQPPLWLLALLLTREVLQTISVTVMRLVPSLHRALARLRFQGPPAGQGHHGRAVPQRCPAGAEPSAGAPLRLPDGGAGRAVGGDLHQPGAPDPAGGGTSKRSMITGALPGRRSTRRPSASLKRVT